MRALLVEDHRLSRKLLKELLLEESVLTEVREAGDGWEALALLQEEEFDLAIVDIDLPFLDGISLIGKARSRKPRLPCLVMSALPAGESAARAESVGAAFLPKGCAPEKIVDAVKSMAGRLGDENIEDPRP